MRADALRHLLLTHCAQDTPSIARAIRSFRGRRTRSPRLYARLEGIVVVDVHITDRGTTHALDGGEELGALAGAPLLRVHVFGYSVREGVNAATDSAEDDANAYPR